MIRRRNSPCLVEAWALAKRSNFMQGIRQLPTNPVRRAAIQCVAGSNHCLTRSGLDRLPGWILPERHCPLLDFPELKSSSFTNTTLFYSLKTTTTQGKWMLLTLRGRIANPQSSQPLTRACFPIPSSHFLVSTFSVLQHAPRSPGFQTAISSRSTSFSLRR